MRASTFFGQVIAVLSRRASAFEFRRPPRVWHPGARKPLDHPPVLDRHGRLWHWDPNLMFWIHHGRDEYKIEASCSTFEDLAHQHGPLTER